MIKKHSSARLSRMSKKSSSKKPKGLATLMEAEDEDKDDVESGDEGADDEEEKVDEVVYPSKLTNDQKVGRLGRF
jgi:hypothetical protein